jgi:hypothetical protein
MNSWKTSLCGVLGLIGICLIKFFPEYAKIGEALLFIAPNVGLVMARDNDKTSEQAGAGRVTVQGNLPLQILIGFIALGFFFGPGCASLEKGADPVVVRAEQTLTVATSAFDTFLKLDNDNRALVKQKAPQVHEFAEWLREPSQFPGSTNVVARWACLVESAELTKLAYKQNRSADNKANLVTALATLQTAVDQAQSQLAELNTLK